MDFRSTSDSISDTTNMQNETTNNTTNDTCEFFDESVIIDHMEIVSNNSKDSNEVNLLFGIEL